MSEVCSYCGETKDADNDGKYCNAKQGDHRWFEWDLARMRRAALDAVDELLAHILDKEAHERVWEAREVIWASCPECRGDDQ